MANHSVADSFSRDIYSVSRLNSEVRAVLEGSFPLIWVEGEISNLAAPASGHLYFSLKDSHAQVRCAMFRMQRRYLRFRPENGMQVLLRARVGLYEGRGDFQLIAEHMEAAGEGALRQAFERLKQQLAKEGLFAPEKKQALPPFPHCIGVITSPSGAAIRDVLSVIKRRFPGLPVIVYPVPVQGDDAADAIRQAIRLANQRHDCDLLILTRGGGSLEDLMPFNDEGVARAIADSGIPIVSAVGHEIDFTIADLVADQRAPTPSAAAEMVTPDRIELSQHLQHLNRRLQQRMQQQLDRSADRLAHLHRRLLQQDPGNRLLQWQQRLDELEQRLRLAIGNRIQRLDAQLRTIQARLSAQTPLHLLTRIAQQRQLLEQRLHLAMHALLHHKQQRLAALAANLHTLSPLATLQRGYSITRLLPDKGVLQSATDAAPGDQLETLLAQGRLISRVESVIPEWPEK